MPQPGLMCGGLPRAVLEQMKPLGTQSGPGLPLKDSQGAETGFDPVDVPVLCCGAARRLMWGTCQSFAPSLGGLRTWAVPWRAPMGKAGAVMPSNLQTQSLPQEKGGWGDILGWYQRAEHEEWHGAGTGLPWCCGALQHHIPLCSLHLTGQPDPHQLCPSPTLTALTHLAPHLLHLRISFCPCCLCPCALTKGWTAPNRALPLTATTRVNPSGKAAHAARGLAKVMMIHARERPHTGGVILLKCVELAKSTPGATSTSPPPQRGAGTAEGPHRAAGTWLTPQACQGHPAALPSLTPHPLLASCTSPCLAWFWGIASVAWVPVHPEVAVSC